MAQVFPGRYTAESNEPMVVFLVGMRVNQLLAVRKWFPAFRAMMPMLNTLFGNPEKGMLGAHTWVGWRSVMLVQYWRSFDHLERFARDPNDPHAAAMREFFKNVGNDGSVGIWHETYLVEAGAMEAVYNNMPQFGLAAATAHVPVTAGRGRARQRLRQAQGEAAAAQV
ncbi:MAG: DUF4188 domain-containing protein [Chloroflexota bacterium]|nr:MAG: DUF4188 domain-containing protein [Chloroflexota bacterium]